MSEPGVIAVTGLRTPIGRQLVPRLLAASPSRRVVGLDVRRPPRFDERAHFVQVDLTSPTADGRLAEILHDQQAEALIHLAFRADPTPDAEADHELETVGSFHLLNACAAAKVGRIVVQSGTQLYGAYPDNPNFLTEAHALRGHADAHAIRDRIEMESLVSAWSARHRDVDVTVLRHPWIFGETYWNQVVRYFALPVVAVPLGYDPMMQFIHESDIVDVFEKAVLASHPGIFNIVGSEVLPLSHYLRLAAKRVWRLPAPFLDRLAYFPSESQTGDPARAFFDYLRYVWVADGTRGWDAFGEPRYSSREAWISFVSSRRMRRYR